MTHRPKVRVLWCILLKKLSIVVYQAVSNCFTKLIHKIRPIINFLRFRLILIRFSRHIAIIAVTPFKVSIPYATFPNKIM
jgi:hypothetical protein